MIDHADDPDVKQLLALLQGTIDGIFSGDGFKLDMLKVLPAITAGKRLAGKDGAGKYVASRVFGDLVNNHPEVIDLAFQGLSEVAKNRIRTMLDARPVKDAERA